MMFSNIFCLCGEEITNTMKSIVSSFLETLLPFVKKVNTILKFITY